jgi:glucose/mannose-6-phosphate isomerase
MNLDDLQLFKQIDRANMLGHINALPDQLKNAWEHAQGLDLSTARNIDRVVICGMGGSAISGDLLAALIFDTCPVSITIVRGYDLPAYAAGEGTLVIALSHSGSTEETISAAQQALERGLKPVAITTGGELTERVAAGGGTVWNYTYDAQPRASLGWLYGLLLAAVTRLGLISDLGAEVEEAIAVMHKHREPWGVDVTAACNPAKRYAGQIVDSIPVIWGAGLLAPVARRWKTQINENAKSCAFFDELPELNHNTVVGIAAPDELIRRHKFQIIQLTSSYDHPRVALRHQATHDMLLGEAIITDPLKARGESRLAQQMSMILFGDFVSYYLAMAYQVDPTPIPPIETLKAKLAQVE